MKHLAWCFKMVHCWADKMEVLGIEKFYETLEDDNPEGIGSTCMLEDGHEGPHKFVRDDLIGVTFL